MNAMVSREPPEYGSGDNALSQTPEGGLRTENSPANSLVAITKSDSTIYSPPLRGVYNGGTGDIAILAQGDTTPQTFSSVPTGAILPVNAVKVMSTNTTSSNLIGMR